MDDLQYVNDHTPLLGENERTAFSYSDDKIELNTVDTNELIRSFEHKEFKKHCFKLDDIKKAFLHSPIASKHETCLPAATIVCIYVVSFDVRKGNVIEWHHPKKYDPDGIEFKALASGSHRVQTDFIYFKQENFFGLACFESLSVPNTEERGFRMKSVGVLATNYTSLHKHMQFLQLQVRKLLKNPGSYNELEIYYEANKEMLSTSKSFFCNKMKEVSIPVPLMKITHPAGCFSQFINFFGVQIFALWKMVLLQKRIVIFSPSPIGVVCYRVYSTVCLGVHRIAEFSHLSCHPLFYVSVADIKSLKGKTAFIACTTEKIFECKDNLYDLYVDNQNLMCDKILLGSADDFRYSMLCDLQSEIKSISGCGNSSISDDEMWFIGFFMTLNERLFNTLLKVSRSEDKTWTNEHMRSVLLDPGKDDAFILELADVYNLNITVIRSGGRCCW